MSNICSTCEHATIERHEDYMGSPCWYLGDCDVKPEVCTEETCDSYKQGNPKFVDCRLKSDIEFTI